MAKYTIGSDIDLDKEVVLDSAGERITGERAEKMAEHALRQARRGRPSLTGDRRQSPQISFRVPESIARRVSELAKRQGKTVSQLSRDALERYLDTVR